MQSWTVSQGIASTWQVTARDADDNPIAYTGNEALAGSVRVARDLAPLFTLAPAWADAPGGLVNVTIPGPDTAALAPGSYLVQVTLADGSADLYEGFLAVEYSPGTAAGRTTYLTWDQVTRRAKFVEALARKGPDPTAVEARADAWDWLVDLLQRHYRGGGGLSRDYYFLPWPSYAGGDPNALVSLYRPGIRSLVLQQWIDTGGPNGTTGVILTTPVLEALADYAVGRICEGEIGPKDNGYERLARQFGARAELKAAQLTVEIDTNGDGVAEVAIKLGTADTLEG